MRTSAKRVSLYSLWLLLLPLNIETHTTMKCLRYRVTHKNPVWELNWLKTVWRIQSHYSNVLLMCKYETLLDLRRPLLGELVNLCCISLFFRCIGYTPAGTPYKVPPTQSNGAPPPYTPTPTPYPTAMYPIRSAYPQQNLYTQVRMSGVACVTLTVENVDGVCCCSCSAAITV